MHIKKTFYKFAIQNKYKTFMQLSKRSKVSLPLEEQLVLKKYIEELDPASAFINIFNATRVRRDTVMKLIDRGWAELRVIEKMQQFLTELVETDYYKNLVKLNKNV